jgi:hypothetical protein
MLSPLPAEVSYACGDTPRKVVSSCSESCLGGFAQVRPPRRLPFGGKWPAGAASIVKGSVGLWVGGSVGPWGKGSGLDRDPSSVPSTKLLRASM